MPIQYICCLNKQGVLRLFKVFDHRAFQNIDTTFANGGPNMRNNKNHQVNLGDYLSDVFKLITTRDHKKQSSFVILNPQTKLIYKRYAGLYFLMGVDFDEDNELMYLTKIHFLVEVLDELFNNNVCELDLVFNFNRVYLYLDEIFQAGELIESDKHKIIQRCRYLESLN